MGRKKIDEQTVAQWIHLWRKGRSYRSIGGEFEVDSRTVKSWIQKAGEERGIEQDCGNAHECDWLVRRWVGMVRDGCDLTCVDQSEAVRCLRGGHNGLERRVHA